MKAYTRMLYLIAAILLAAIAVFALLTRSYRSHETDPLLLNDMLQTVKAHWEDMDSLDTGQFAGEMLIFNSEDFIVYSTAQKELTGIGSVQEAIHRGCVCLAVSEDSRFLGTIVIPDPDKTYYVLARRRLLIACGVTALLFLLAGLLYGSYVHRTIIAPFRKMERFAENVAGGNLDEPLMLEQDNLFGAFTVSFDIMREELKASRQRENALKIREKELIASLSHDLKTPLTGIKLLCELLRVKVQDEYVTAKISSIHQKAEQMDVLISDLLASSLEDIGELTVHCQDEPSSILQELLTAHDTQGLITGYSIPECMLSADRQRISQIIGNIISNSYKYAGTEIDVSSRFKDGYLELSIQDHGKGVPEEELELLTNKFYRGKTNSAGKDGSGLGLYIASELMAKMNGELICSSRGDGFRVTLLIPLS